MANEEDSDLDYLNTSNKNEKVTLSKIKLKERYGKDSIMLVNIGDIQEFVENKPKYENNFSKDQLHKLLWKDEKKSEW